MERVLGQSSKEGRAVLAVLGQGLSVWKVSHRNTANQALKKHIRMAFEDSPPCGLGLQSLVEPEPPSDVCPHPSGCS